MVRNHLEALEKHWHDEELPSYLEPLVLRVWKHEQLLSNHSPPGDEADVVGASSSNDDGHGTSVVFFPTTDQETKPPAEQAAHLLPGSDTNTAEEPAIYLPPSDEEIKPLAEQLTKSGDNLMIKYGFCSVL
ncbi:hypothetical protein ANCCAN_07472 [Ancylostoma caninum]|uniref:Uncharacterized protein n=1 Tax=Ancylostoma caninum TaxID=29170 RepID=A0A368GT60_ANCCA|nr:hypothetical protein ANCCAN_07472 [Ancylostoma caninum]